MLLVVAIVGAVDPSARSAVDRGFNRARYDLVPSYSNVPLERVVAEHNGACGPSSMTDNDTIYWYTQPAGSQPERIVITLAPSFRGTVGRIVFTPLVANSQAPPSGAASPAPYGIRVSSQPAGEVSIAQLDNPPKLQAISVNFKVTEPSTIFIRALTTDPGARPGACAETGVVLNERKG